MDVNTYEKQELSKTGAILVASYFEHFNKAVCEEHLSELKLLCETLKLKTLDTMTCHTRKVSAATFISTGKLDELRERIKAAGADLVVFDDEISPAQQKNLEEELKIRVIDRREVIIGVFAERAETKEARLQVELAELKYQAPRLKRLWTHLSRQAGTAGGGKGGGGGYLKGEGEKQIEIDRRILKRKVAQLEKEIEEVRGQRSVQRQMREKGGTPIFAIVGYTNAGKSTLMNALTDANVFVEDKLFATLDTKTRKFLLDNNQEILLVDTVGFIRKLPHLLVAAFKSTLEEAAKADILIHLIDASHPMAEEQAKATMAVLEELGAKDKPTITVLNKVDLLPEDGHISKIRLMYPKTVRISALQKIGFDALKEAMHKEILSLRRLATFKIPQKDYHVVSEILRFGHVVEQTYEENDVLLKAEVPVSLAERLQAYIVE